MVCSNKNYKSKISLFRFTSKNNLGLDFFNSCLVSAVTLVELLIDVNKKQDLRKGPAKRNMRKMLCSITKTNCSYNLGKVKNI